MLDSKTTSTAISSTQNIAGDMLMPLVTAFVAGQPSRQRHLVDTDLMTDESSSAAQSDGDGRMSDPLLMPVWAYQTAAAYLIAISIVGLVMNILVIIAIVSDRQVIHLWQFVLLLSLIQCLNVSASEDDGAQLDAAQFGLL